MVDSTELLPPCLEKPIVINIGLEIFFQSLVDQGAEVIHVNWKPIAIENDQYVQDILEQLL